MAALIMLCFLAGCYLLPGFVSVANKKRQNSAIWTLNIFLGWTLIGWVIALVWAMMKD